LVLGEPRELWMHQRCLNRHWLVDKFNA